MQLAENRALLVDEESVVVDRSEKIDSGMIAAVLVAALGYFVDTYDLALFSMLRVQSLKDLGFSPQEILREGTLLLNIQMVGMLIGGFVWGSLGDRWGRMKVLYASIAVYSLGTFATAYVQSLAAYGFWRFIAGVGMAGEIGVGITLVSELLPAKSRGIGTTLVATLGICGMVAAALVVEFFSWRTNYMIGGALGFILLALRIRTHESPLFKDVATRSDVRCGRLRDIFCNKERLLRYCNCIAIGLPIWFVVGILVTLAPEVAVSLGITEPVKVSVLIGFGAAACAIGDLVAGLVSQAVGSRKKAIGLFVTCAAGACALTLMLKLQSATAYYLLISTVYFFVGYWCVFLTTSAEQFGTNIRATVTTSVPNVVRGTTVPITMSFLALSNWIGIYGAVCSIGFVVFSLSLLGLWRIEESFNKDLSFVE